MVEAAMEVNNQHKYTEHGFAEAHRPLEASPVDLLTLLIVIQCNCKRDLRV